MSSADPHQIAKALAKRDKEASTCPADKQHLGDKDCPKCGASSAGPCWIKHNADGAFVEAVRASIGQDKQGVSNG